MDSTTDWKLAIQNNSSISELLLTSSLSDPEFSSFSEGLRHTKHLTSLSLSNIALSGDQVRKLSQALSLNRSLTRLNLDGASLGSNSARLIIEAISESTQASAISEAIHASLEGSLPSATPTGILEIDLSNNGIGDDGIQAIAPLIKKTHLQTLLLKNNQITTEGFKRFFSELPRNIQGTTIKSQKVVTKIPFSLHTLDLSGNAPGLEGIKAAADFLSINTTLNHIKLSNSQLGDSSVSFISNSLGSSTLSRLTKIDLSQNQIGDEGALSLIKLLATNHLMVHINVSDNHISPEKEAEIVSLTEYNKKLVSQRSTLPWKSESSIVIQTEDGTTVGVTCATLVSNGLVFIGTSYGDVYVWNPAGDVSTPQKPGLVVPPPPSSGELLVDSAYLRTGKIEAKIITYEPESRLTKRRINALVDNLDGTIWCVTDERFITIIGIDDRTVQKRLPLHKYQAIAISKFGPDIYLGGATGEVSLWHSESMVCRHEIVLDGRFPISSIYSDGQYIFVGVLVLPARAGHVLIFSLTMELLHHFEAHNDIVSSIHCVNGQIITSSWDNHIKVWRWDSEAKTTNLEHDLDDHHSRVTSLVTADDKLISCSDDNTLIVWDLSKPRGEMIEKRMLGAWGGSVSSLQASRGKLVSCSHKEGRVTLWTKE